MKMLKGAELIRKDVYVKNDKNFKGHCEILLVRFVKVRLDNL